MVTGMKMDANLLAYFFDCPFGCPTLLCSSLCLYQYLGLHDRD